MKKRNNIEGITYGQNQLRVVVDGNTYKYELSKNSGLLANATKTQHEAFEVSPSGYGIHWPLIACCD